MTSDDVDDVENVVVSTTDVPTVNLIPIDHRQETTRGLLAMSLVGLLAFMLVSTFVAVLFFGVAWETISDPVTYLLGLVVGLVGTVVGFYFGQKGTSGN